MRGAELHRHLEQEHHVRPRFVDERTDEQLREWHAVDHAEHRYEHGHLPDETGDP